MTASQLAELTALSDAEILALAYEEAACGDLRRALMMAVVDHLTLEETQAKAVKAISSGFVRGAIPTA